MYKEIIYITYFAASIHGQYFFTVRIYQTLVSYDMFFLQIIKHWYFYTGSLLYPQLPYKNLIYSRLQSVFDREV